MVLGSIEPLPTLPRGCITLPGLQNEEEESVEFVGTITKRMRAVIPPPGIQNRSGPVPAGSPPPQCSAASPHPLGFPSPASLSCLLPDPS